MDILFKRSLSATLELEVNCNRSDKHLGKYAKVLCTIQQSGSDHWEQTLFPAPVDIYIVTVWRWYFERPLWACYEKNPFEGHSIKLIYFANWQI